LVKRKIGGTQQTPVGKYVNAFLLDNHLGEHLSGDILKLSSVALVRERTISTETPPLVGEVSAKFRG
jgi:hypothetical protein